jgi:arylsulfate sulfotransferase
MKLTYGIPLQQRLPLPDTCTAWPLSQEDSEWSIRKGLIETRGSWIRGAVVLHEQSKVQHGSGLTGAVETFFGTMPKRGNSKVKSYSGRFLVSVFVAALPAFSASIPTAISTTDPVKGVPATSGVHPDATAGFSLSASPVSIQLTSGSAQELTVVAFPENGFTGSVGVKIGTLPAGVVASPASFTLVAGTLRVISLSASLTAKPGVASVKITGTSGAITESATVSLKIAANTTSASLSGTFFDFGNDLVKHTLTQTAVAVTNTGSNVLTMSPALTGDSSYSIVKSKSCGAHLAVGRTCDMVIQYLPVSPSAPKPQNAMLYMHFGNATAATPEAVALTGISAVLPAGQVTKTNNPQVALYTMTLPFPGSITVRFGLSTSYGQKTWSQSTDVAGGQVSIFVAGMLANETYHMKAIVQFPNGITATDQDHTFATQGILTGLKIPIAVKTTAGMKPQPGLELLNPTGGVIITDLEGHELWEYHNPGNINVNDTYGVKLLPDGDFLLTIGALSSNPLLAPLPADSILEMREVNLAGDTVREISIADLNLELASATCAECNVTLQTFHHDVEPLANGHWLVLANTLMNLSATSTPPLTNAPAQAVLADVIVDLDENMQPVWAWNEFNHLDPNRHPMQFPDLTHTNAVVYSPDDGNLLVSMRHQNWVVKVDYANGTGKGDILWKLGEGGTFKLAGGTDPTDWQYAQHGPAFFSPNTTGIFLLGVMDNGNDRMFPSNVTCGTTGEPACQYTTVPIFKIDEKAKTATLVFHQELPVALYSYFGGNVDLLDNGNMEYDDCGAVAGSYIYEVTQEASPKTVWQMHTPGYGMYRAFRIPGLYPGVPWQ